jgi:ligand-binding SRPBCC domain-containing protein
MQLYRLQRTQHLPIAPETAWRFFSDPRNLRHITPPWLDFQMTSTVPETIHAGTIITYTIRPIARVPVRWVTEITHAAPPHRFVDEQRFGPYRFWHHQHHFRPTDDGVEVEDLVHYALSLGPLGRLAHGLTVRHRLDAIFAYRRRALAERFAPRARPILSSAG